MHKQLCGYKVEEKLYLGVCEQKRLNTTDADDNALGDMPVSKTANEVTEERNKGFWWKNMDNYFSQSKPLFNVYRSQNRVQVEMISACGIKTCYMNSSGYL
jgi:hypothetical protein